MKQKLITIVTRTEDHKEHDEKVNDVLSKGEIVDIQTEVIAGNESRYHGYPEIVTIIVYKGDLK